MELVLDLEKSIPPEGYAFDGAKARIITKGEEYMDGSCVEQWAYENSSTYEFFPLKRAKWEPKIGDEVWVINATVCGGWVVLSFIFGGDIDRCLKVFKTKEAALAALDQLNNAPTGE